MAIVRLESLLALLTWFGGLAGVQNTILYFYSYSAQFEISIVSFPSTFKPFEVVVLSASQRGPGSGRGEHLDLTRRTRKIRGSVTDPTQRSGSSEALTVPFFVQKFCRSPVEAHAGNPMDGYSLSDYP